MPSSIDSLVVPSLGDAPEASPRSLIGLLLADPMQQRLVSGVAAQLELEPVILTTAWLQTAFVPSELARFDLIVADASSAVLLRKRMGEDGAAEAALPAIIAAIPQANALLAAVSETQSIANAIPASSVSGDADATVVLPQAPATLLAQLSVIVYAHRAFARRYKSALEELHLNRRIFRSVTSGITVANATLPDMPLMYVNPAFEVMTGYALEDVLGKNCRFLQAGERDQPGLTLLRDALREQREVTATIRNYRRDGSLFWNELSLSPIRNREGQLTHFVGIQNDVTARVEFESALRESEKLAAVGRLSASIAHEINNPLEATTNLLYLAQHSDDLQSKHDYIAQAEEELRRVALITTQSLRFYRQSTAPTAVLPSALLDDVLDLTAGKLRDSSVEVLRRDRMKRHIVCMQSEIRQVLANLIRNAADAMSAAGGRLLVRTSEGTHPHTGVRGAIFTVADTGTGIAAADLQRIFTAFFTTKGVSGTGLGLWVSCEIVRRHHGDLRVRSRLRKLSPAPGAEPRAADSGGTVFRLFVPYQGISPGAERQIDTLTDEAP